MNHPKRITQNESPNTNYPKRITQHKLPNTNYPTQITQHKLPNTNYPPYKYRSYKDLQQTTVVKIPPVMYIIPDF